MGSPFDPIEIPIVIDDSKIASQMGNVGKAIEKSSAGAKLALWGVGEQAGDLARSLGLPNQMARKLEDTTESLAAKLGKGAIAFGAVGLAATAGIGIWNSYREAEEKAAEATRKAADAAVAWVDAARASARETDNLTESKKRQWEIDKRQSEFDLERGIRQQTKDIIELTEKMEGLRTRAAMSGTGGSLIGRLIYKDKQTRQDEYRQAVIDYDRQVNELQAKYESLDILHGKAGGVKQKFKGAAKQQEKKDFEYNAEVEYLQAMDQLWNTQDKNYQGHLDMQLAIFDAQSSAKLNKMSAEGASIAQIKDAAAVEDVRRMQLVAVEEDRVRQVQLAKEKAAAAEKAAMNKMVADMAISVGGDLLLWAMSSGKKHAAAQKREAKHQVYVSTAAGIARALKDYAYPYSLVVGGLVAAAGAVQLGKINSTDYGSGGSIGSGGSGGGTFSGGTGEDNYRYFNYEQSTYGTGWRPGAGPTGNTTIIYAMDGKDVERVLMENSGSVKKSYDHAEKGYA